MHFADIVNLFIVEVIQMSLNSETLPDKSLLESRAHVTSSR